MIIDGIDFTEYDLKSVKMDLETCNCEFEVIFHKDKKRVVRKKIYKVETDCNVDINEEIQKLIKKIDGTSI